MVAENLVQVQKNIEESCKTVNRDPGEVTLIAVSKTKPVEMLQEAYAAGARVFGENKVQEIVDKYDQMPADVQWHMIGHLQRNKVKYIVDKVAMIHSVDSLRLAETIEKEAEKKDVVVPILIEVNVAQEESKFGISTDETEELIRRILENCPNIKIRGLMCIAPFAEDPNDIRVYFAEVKKLYDQYSKIEHERLDFQYLSMGMSHDYELAARHGATMVRIGSALMGARDYGPQGQH